MYDQKDKIYFSNIRYDLINLIPPGNKYYKVLEIGCGYGDTLIEIKKQGIADEVTGIDLISFKKSNQEKLDHFIAGDIEKLELNFISEEFDLIILGDVLEHLVDPWSVLKKIKQYLKQDGYIIASLPNIRYYPALLSIVVHGDFRYEDAGILDRTHLRFFCKKNIIELFNSSDFCIETIMSAFDKETKGKRYWFNKLTFGLFHDFFVFQYLIRAKNKRKD